MHLQVLASGDVAPSPAVALDHHGQRVELVGGDCAVRHSDANHVVAASLALAVIWVQAWSAINCLLAIQDPPTAAIIDSET